MNDQISWYVHLAVQAERLDEFRSLTDDMVEKARAEAGTLVYERFIGETQTDVHLYERYVDSTAAVFHLNSFKENYGEHFSRLASRKRFIVFGNPSAELRAILVSLGAEFAVVLAGFSRL